MESGVWKVDRKAVAQQQIATGQLTIHVGPEPRCSVLEQRGGLRRGAIPMRIQVVMPIVTIALFAGSVRGQTLQLTEPDREALAMALHRVRTRDLPDSPIAIQMAGRLLDRDALAIARRLSVAARRDDELVECSKLPSGRMNCIFRSVKGAVGVVDLQRLSAGEVSAVVWTAQQMTSELHSWIYYRQYDVRLARRGGV